jgi:nucleotide-binding universal stress UspA family protein
MGEERTSNLQNQTKTAPPWEPGAEREHSMKANPLYESIIVPLDGSTAAERALPIAIALAERCRAVVRLLRIVGENESIAPAIDYLDDAARSLGSHIHALPPVVMDDAAEGICETVAYASHPLVCMSSHGRGGLGRAALGSVAESVIRQSDQPVLLVGPHVRVEGNLPWETLLGTFDGSSRSEAVLPLAADWAEALGMRLILVNAIEPETEKQMDGFDVLDTNYAKGLLPRVQRPGVESGWDVLHERDAGKAIVRYAADVSASVIAMTTHGRSGLARLAAGSTTMMVVHEAPCPVLVLRSAPAAEEGASRKHHEHQTS